MSGEKMKCAEAYGNYNSYFSNMRNLAAQYGNMPIDSVYSAFSRASMATNPYVQNRRVKAISSMPVDYGKDKVAEMIKSRDGNEKPLRQVDHALEGSAYPFFKIRKTYQDINTYRYYTYPAYLEAEDAKADEFWREGMLLDKLNATLKPDQWAHQIIGQVLQEGKIAYLPRISIDKSHNKINYAFLQQLPSDWWKIVGFNNISKYTIMFDMMYFLQPGADWRQFGDLFMPYINDFNGILEPTFNTISDYDIGKNAIFASANSVKAANGGTFRVNIDKFNKMRQNAAGSPKIYNQNGQWAYWVTLPIDKVWVAEIDDTSRTVTTPFTGLFLAMDQLAAYESVQMEIVQNPLVSVVLGEIPYFQDKDNNKGEPDKYQLSPAGKKMFETYWYQMLQAANTGGIGLYLAPANNLHLESLKEAPNATDISTNGYKYAVQKSGLSGLIPVNDDPRAGAVNVSAAMEERYCLCVYSMMENMMNHLYSTLNLKYDWRFKMFGGFSTENEALEKATKGMEHGILSDTFEYMAIRGRSVFADLAMSRMIKESGILDLRIPLITSYSAKNTDPNLPPQTKNKGGRPKKSVLQGGDSNEEAIDDNL